MLQQQLLTEGKAFSTLLRFSLPFLLSNILQACYGASDLFMVGRFADSISVSAVATGGQIMQTITGLAIGLATGGTVLIGQYFGARKIAEVSNIVKTIIVVFSVLSLVMTALTILFLEPLITLMQVPLAAVSTTRQYLLICSCGIIFIVGYNAISGILRGLGDSRTPLLLITIACLINISTDLLFVGLFRMGAVGAALSTVLAQAISLLLAALYLSAKGFWYKYNNYTPHFSLSAARQVLMTGLPIALQEGLVNISFLIITAIVNSLGLIASAAVGVVEKLIVFSMLPTTAFAAALSAITAQHHGADMMTRARKCLHISIGLSLVFGITFFLAAQNDAAFLVSIFTKDAPVIAAGAEYLRSYSLDSIIVCFVFCMNGFLNGGGYPLFTLIHSLLTTIAVRIPLSYLLSQAANASMFQIGLAAPTASLLSLAICEWFIIRKFGPFSNQKNNF